MDGGGAGWGLITIIGPIVLIGIIAFAVIRNRQKSSPRDMARTEAATRDLYRAEDAAEKASDKTAER